MLDTEVRVTTSEGRQLTFPVMKPSETVFMFEMVCSGEPAGPQWKYTYDDPTIGEVELAPGETVTSRRLVGTRLDTPQLRQPKVGCAGGIFPGSNYGLCGCLRSDTTGSPLLGARFGVAEATESRYAEFVLGAEATEVAAGQETALSLSARDVDTGEEVAASTFPDTRISLAVSGGGELVYGLARGGELTDVPFSAVAGGLVTFVGGASSSTATVYASWEPAGAGDSPLDPDDSGAVRIRVTAPAQPLTVVADPDTVEAGGEVRFAVSAPGLDPGAPVTFSVPDASLGGFRGSASARSASGDGGERLTSVTRTLGTVDQVRFGAIDTAPGEAATVAVTVEAAGKAATVDIVVLPSLAVVGLLSADDRAYTRSDLNVSRFAPADGGLRSSVPFVSPDAGKTAAYDPFTSPGGAPVADPVDLYTVRPELRPAASGGTVTFEIEVVRPWGSNLTSTFAGVEGVDGTTTVYRADRPFRLVATDRDDAEGTSSPDQTLLVRLGDMVYVQATFDGSPIGARAEYTVGLPPGTTPTTPDALPKLSATLNWIWDADFSGAVAPALTAERASETWAQGSVAFANRLPDNATDADWGAYDDRAIRNTLFVRFPLTRLPISPIPIGSTNKAPDDGSFVVSGTIGGVVQTASVAFSEGERLLDVVRRLATEVESVFGVPVEWFPVGKGENTGEFFQPRLATRFYLVVGGARDAEVVLNADNESADGLARREPLYNRALSLEHTAAIVAARGDGDLSTIEVVVVPPGTLVANGVNARGRGVTDDPTDADLLARCSEIITLGPDEYDCAYYNPIVNSLFVHPEHVDGPIDWSGVVPHELGHVLEGGGHPGMYGSSGAVEEDLDFQDEYDFRPGAPVEEHVMFGSAGPTQGILQRRLDQNYVKATRIRGTSGAPVLR